MKIGIVTTWFERGAAYVSKQFMETLEALGHEVYIYARGGEEFAKGNPKWDLDNVTWNRFLFSPVPTDICRKQYESWLDEKEIEVVIFNEQQFWQPILWTKDKSILTVAYIDYYTVNSIGLFELYDQLWCNTKRHASAFEWHDGMRYLPWGTNIDLFKPQSIKERVDNKLLTFFHSAGLNPYRKGTDLVISAVKELLKRGVVDFKVVIHIQTNLVNFFPELKDEIEKLIEQGYLEVIEKTVSAPGLYHLGDVYVYPSRLEGIGLTIAEAISCGLPAIVTDEAPMNEFIEASSCRAVKVNGREQRKDGYYWDMAFVDIFKLADAMNEYISDSDFLLESKIKVRQHAVEHLNFEKNKSEIEKVLVDLKPRVLGSNIRTAIDSEDSKYTRFYRDVPNLYRTLFSFAKTLKRKMSL